MCGLARSMGEFIAARVILSSSQVLFYSGERDACLQKSVAESLNETDRWYKASAEAA